MEKSEFSSRAGRLRLSLWLGDAGRPAQNDEDVKSVNLDQVGANAQTNRNAGYVQCRICAGLTASACAANNAFETCNDAQDACQVEIRGTMTAGKYFIFSNLPE